MREFKTPEDLREYLLNIPHDFDDTYYDKSGSCYAVSLKKEQFIIRINNKKVGFIDINDIPVNLRKDPKVILMISNALRKCNGSIEGVKNYLKDI